MVGDERKRCNEICRNKKARCNHVLRGFCEIFYPSIINPFKSMHKKHWELWELLNQMKFAEMAVILNNLLNGNAKLEEMEPTALKICSLFINTKDEDRTIWNADLCSNKINDWKLEGYDMQDFFRLALGTVDGYADIYKEMSRRISPMTNQEESEKTE